MTEAAVGLLRILLWLLPGIFSFLAVRGFLAGRVRVGIGMLVAALLVAFIIKPVLVGLGFVVIGALAGLGGGRNPKYKAILEERKKHQR